MEAALHFLYTATGHCSTLFTLSVVAEHCCLDTLSFYPRARKEQEHYVLLLQVSCLHCPWSPEFKLFCVCLQNISSLFTQFVRVHEMYHKEQKALREGARKCTKYLLPGHRGFECKNPVVCLACYRPDHRRGDTLCELFPQQTEKGPVLHPPPIPHEEEQRIGSRK